MRNVNYIYQDYLASIMPKKFIFNPIKRLWLEVKKLRQKVAELEKEKADLEILLETAISHADIMQSLLQESNSQLLAEIEERQRAEIRLESLLARVTRDKIDLEIILETTTTHSDNLENWLRNQSIRDPLTGLFNRRYMEEYLSRELKHAQSLDHGLGIIMIDIDYFKQFNDTWGHQVGDMILQEVGFLLQTLVKYGGVACRYGGEELLLILPETPLMETYKKAELIRQGVKNIRLDNEHQGSKSITISSGIASFPEHGTTESELILAADRALYQAKSQGRDQVIIASL